MAQVATYLNFNRNTEEAFNFYKSVFGTEFMGVMRHADAGYDIALDWAKKQGLRLPAILGN